MVLSGHINASYLSEFKAHSCVGGHLLLSNNSSNPPNNGYVLKMAQIIKAVMSSATEAEHSALYMNLRKAIPACHTLITIGHLQPPTPMQTINNTSPGVVKNTIAPWRTKSMDM